METSGREKTEHLLVLKVMRLTRPSLATSQILTTELRDLPGSLLNSHLKNETTSVPGAETLSPSTLLLLPQCFGNIYLGETFTSYICVHNVSSQVAKDATFKVSLQTNMNTMDLSTVPLASNDIEPGATVDQLINHEVKEFGAHILICEINYFYGNLTSEPLTFRKFFKFEVLKPLDVKTKLYTAESNEVYLEAQVQNITSGSLILEKVSLETSDLFRVSELNTTTEVGDLEVSTMSSGDSRQFLYSLTPVCDHVANVKVLSKTTYIGKLDIVWKSNLGEKGRLQTSQLQRSPPDLGEIHLSVDKVPATVLLEQAFNLKFSLSNTSDRTMEMVLYLGKCSNFAWCSSSGMPVGVVAPGNSVSVVVKMIPLMIGLQSISGIRVEDPFLKRMYEFDNVSNVYVVQSK
uniref:Putative trafficking protein particle complex subunit 13 n=1 Tax=Triatoma dimidiata TaxID=72491 RepID=A0A0V0GCH1_TRIDM